MKLAEGSSRQYDACLLLFLMSREPAFIDESLYEWPNISTTTDEIKVSVR